jgi:hypothetical protein
LSLIQPPTGSLPDPSDLDPADVTPVWVDQEFPGVPSGFLGADRLTVGID